MAAKRTVPPAAFQAPVARAAPTGDCTVNERAGPSGVHPTLIHGWKKQLVTGAESIVGSPARQAAPIGRLQRELEWLQKKRPPSCEHKRLLIEPGHPALSSRRPGELLGLSRSRLSDEPGGETAEPRRRMRLIDEQSTAGPFSGRRRRTEGRSEAGAAGNRKRVQRLMRVLGREAISPKPRLRAAGKGPAVAPDRRRGVTSERADPVGSAASTDGPRTSGFRDRAAVLAWVSRAVIAGKWSHPRDGSIGLEMRDAAWKGGRPAVFHTDPGVPITATGFPGKREAAGVAVSRDGRGRALDNGFVARRWRRGKDEASDLRGAEAVPERPRGLGRYFAC